MKAKSRFYHQSDLFVPLKSQPLLHFPFDARDCHLQLQPSVSPFVSTVAPEMNHEITTIKRFLGYVVSCHKNEAVKSVSS